MICVLGCGLSLENIVQILLEFLEDLRKNESKQCGKFLKVILKGCSSEEKSEIGWDLNEALVPLGFDILQHMAFIINADLCRISACQYVCSQ